MTSLVAELEDAESLAVFLEDQKHQILDDVDQLKGFWGRVGRSKH